MPDYTGLKDLLYKMADDALIIGHRNSEWTGLGPILEEDIAFSSLAQDKVGHAYNLYQILQELGENDPDQVAFARDEKDFKCCHLVEYPIGEYDFSLVRHFFFDNAEFYRYDLLTKSSYKPLADLAKKFHGEIKYHIFHANTWIKQLAKGTEESKARIQSSINEIFPLALGIFEKSEFEDQIIKDNIFDGEEKLQEIWYKQVKSYLNECDMDLPNPSEVEPAFGGRKGFHTQHLKPLLDEMSEVFRIDPSAEW